MFNDKTLPDGGNESKRRGAKCGVCVVLKINQKGEALTIALISIVATLVVAAAIPSLNIFGKVFGGGHTVTAPAEEAWKEQTKTTEPVTIGVTPTGEKVVAFRERKTFRSGASKAPAKLTYGERIGQFFAGLTTWAILGLLGLFLAFGITPAMVIRWAKNRALERENKEKQRYEQTLTRTVAAIREMPEEAYKTLSPILKDKHDLVDKKTVDEIKAKLH